MAGRTIDMPRRPLARLVAALLLLTIAGCRPVGPNYRRPVVATPPTFRFAESQQAASFADLPWWQVFEDPVLQALIRDAIANNLDLRAAAARVERFRGEARVAKSYLYPQVNGAAGATAQ